MTTQTKLNQAYQIIDPRKYRQSFARMQDGNSLALGIRTNHIGRILNEIPDAKLAELGMRNISMDKHPGLFAAAQELADETNAWLEDEESGEFNGNMQQVLNAVQATAQDGLSTFFNFDLEGAVDSAGFNSFGAQLAEVLQVAKRICSDHLPTGYQGQIAEAFKLITGGKENKETDDLPPIALMSGKASSQGIVGNEIFAIRNDIGPDATGRTIAKAREMIEGK